MINKKYTCILLVIVLFSSVLLAQNKIKYLPQDQSGLFDASYLENQLLDHLNTFRLQHQKDYLVKDSILHLAAEEHSKAMADKNELDQSSDDISRRIEHFGGSPFGKEVILKFKIKDKTIPMSYDTLAELLDYELLRRKKELKIVENELYTYLGVGVSINANCDAVFVSWVLGNARSLPSHCPEKAEELSLLSKKKYRLKPYDAKVCRKLDVQNDLFKWQECLSVEDNKIYFETYNYKALRRLIKAPNDALAVDIVQKQQFPFHQENYVDNNTPWTAWLTPPVYTSKIAKGNLIKDKTARKHLRFQIAELPENISQDYELNLVMIKDKHFCKDVFPAYHFTDSSYYQIEASLILDTNSQFNTYTYKCKSERNVLKFRVPFERNSHQFEKKAVEKIVKSLEQPDFLIYKIDIDAYSSVEGKAALNERLQKQRAASLVRLLSEFDSRKSTSIDTEIHTQNNWKDFRKDLETTPYSFLLKKNNQQIYRYIQQKHLWDSLEFILKRHRYVDVQLHIEYDLARAEQEARFVVYKFNQAVAKNDKIQSLAIQKFILQNIEKKRYKASCLNALKIPETADMAGILMNHWAAKNHYGLLPITKHLASRIKALKRLDSDNPYIQFNDVFCHLYLSDFSADNSVENLRQEIDVLYESSLPQFKIDELNILFLFQLQKYLETSKDKTMKSWFKETLEAFKQRVDVQQMPLSNMEKMVQLYMEVGEYQSAKQILFLLLERNNISEKMLWSYIRLMSLSETMWASNHLLDVVKKAYDLNPKKTKSLLMSSDLSFQIFKNKRLKKWFENNVL